MVEIQKTGNIILGIEEYYYDGVRFLFRPGLVKKIVTFSAFPPHGIEQKFNYIKDFLNSNYAFFSFLDTNEPPKDPRGTYYLDENFDDTYLKKINDVILSLSSNITQDETWLLGSSKGGVGALLVGLTYGFKNIVVMAPQCRIAKYIAKRSEEILYYMTHGNSESYIKLDNSLLKKIKYCNKNINWNITILCGMDDKYHLFELEILEKCFWMADIQLKQIMLNGAHDRIALGEYRNYLQNYLN